MYVQFSEELPGVQIDEKERRIFVDQDISDEELLLFYEKILQQDYEYFRISQRYALGLYETKRTLTNKEVDKVKCQVTGPVSFALSLTFKDGRALFYDPKWQDIVVKLIGMKALWQVSFFRDITGNIILFIDEPYLGSIGSGFLNIPEEDVKRVLGEIIQILKGKGILVGIHCCGNTDWQKIIPLGIDIINYDAYNYTDSLLVYPQLLMEHIERGGYIAWGIVPSGEAIKEVSAMDLLLKFQDILKRLTQKGINEEDLIRASLLTPSCGMGTTSEEVSLRVLEVMKDLQGFLRKEV
jgi:methionine synthase II (cobalamin-independent)